MDTQDELGYPFAVSNLWSKSSFADLDLENSSFLIEDLDVRLWQLERSCEELSCTKTPLLGLEPTIPEFDGSGLLSHETSPLKPLEDLGSLESSISSLSDVENDQADIVDDDIWSAPDFLSLERSTGQAKTWESFYDDGFQPSQTCYITEAGPEALDTILVLHESKQGDRASELPPKHILKSDPLLAGLLQLVLGRESVIFHYADTDQGFRSHFGDVRMSGYCPETFNSLTASIISFANRLKALKTFVERAWFRGRGCRALIAFMNFLSRSLLALEAELYQSSQDVHSVLQLQALVKEPNKLLTHLSSLVSQIASVKADEELLIKLYSFAQESDNDIWLRPISISILSHAARPYLSTLSNWLGLQEAEHVPNHDAIPGFVRKVYITKKDDRGKEDIIHEYEFDNSDLPGFITSEEAEAMFEVGQGLHLLHTHSPGHPLLHEKSTAQMVRDMEMRFSWQEIERLETQAKAYEEAVLTAIRMFDTGKRVINSKPSPGGQVFLVSATTTLAVEGDPERYIVGSIKEMEKPLDILQAHHQIGMLSGSTETQDMTSFSPPISLIPSLSFTPIISAQARLVNQSTLRLLFKDHHLRSHLTLQHRYQLLGDGVFAARLSHALFDADIPSAERKKGIPRIGTSGLKLGSRESWPPASSELRLALMGILSDSYHTADTSSNNRSRDLPGGLSFAIRALSEGDLQKCMDPNSISALDFLRMQYKPPAPLDVVISAMSLEKYDTIFKLLLRANRMVYAVTHFSRSPQVTDMVTQRFKIEAHHIVSCVCNYLFENVTTIWNSFEKRLDTLERRIERYEIGEYDRLKRLRDMHDSMLDDMMFALLLRKRQEMVMGLLEEIFSIVLAFAHRERSHDDIDSRTDYERLRKKIKVFIGVCRKLSERKAFSGVGGAAGGDQSDGIGGLLLRLEMSGYYSRSVK